MVPSDARRDPSPDRDADLAWLKVQSERAGPESAALRREIDEGLRELADVQEQQQKLIGETRAASAALAAIRASRTWRMLEAYRRVAGGIRAFRMRTSAARAARRAVRRTLVVPASVRFGTLGVNLAGYIGAESGLGEAARASIRALEAAGVPVALNNVAGAQRTNDTTYTAFVDDHPHPFNLIHLNADNMENFARKKGASYFRDRYSIGFWFWELAQFRDDWLSAFGHVQEVWVASTFAAGALRPVAPVPVVPMRLPVAFHRPPALGRSHFGIPDKPFVFLFTFDVSSQLERKNPLAAIRAFRRAGFDRGQALLVLKYTNADFDRAAVRRLHDEARDLDVRMLDGFMDRQELTALMNAADCYVSLHRAEGFGVTMAEAMSLGIPVIATAYSGNMDFTTPENSGLVDYKLVSLTRDYGPYLRGFQWADPDVAMAGVLMRRLVDEPAWREALGRRGQADVIAHFDLAAAARAMRSRLEAIQTGT